MQERLSTENPAELDSSDDLSVSVWVSFAEIYNETLYDLLDSCPNKKQRNKLKLGQYQDTVYIRYGYRNIMFILKVIKSHNIECQKCQKILKTVLEILGVLE